MCAGVVLNLLIIEDSRLFAICKISQMIWKPAFCPLRACGKCHVSYAVTSAELTLCAAARGDRSQVRHMKAQGVLCWHSEVCVKLPKSKHIFLWINAIWIAQNNAL